MKIIMLTIVCLAAVAESYPLGHRAPDRDDYGEDMEAELGDDIGTDLDMDSTAVATAEAVANGVGTARATAEAVARGSGPSNAVAKAVANTMLEMNKPRSQTAASGYERGTSSGAEQTNAGASGVESQGFHKSGQQNYYNHEHHHSSVTKIEHAESSEEHDIGGSQTFNEGAQKQGAFNQFDKGAKRFGNSIEKAAQRSDSTTL